jgi:predicted transcriptional regulator
MSTTTVELPDSLKQRIEELAVKEGYTVSQFLASAAGEKLAAMLTMDYLRREASAGRREDFERYLAAIPDVTPPDSDRLRNDATARKRKKSSRTHSRKNRKKTR